MTIIKGYKQKQELPNICYCEYCGEEYGRGERDIKTLYKQVDEDIFTVAVCYDCIQLLKQEEVLVGVRNEKIPPPSNMHYEFKDFRIRLG
jgi:hypothetical protein